jgi:hypothetical protein
LPTKSNEAGAVRARAEASFKKEERAKDGAKAMLEYRADSRALLEKTARLKALRLAKEAAEKGNEKGQVSDSKAATGKLRRTKG